MTYKNQQNLAIGPGRSAKPLCAGSIPARASNPSQQRTTIERERLHPPVANWVTSSK